MLNPVHCRSRTRPSTSSSQRMHSWRRPTRRSCLPRPGGSFAPGGWLVASDWLRTDGPVSPQLQQWIEFSGSQETPHQFHLASPSETRSILEALGYADIRIADENDWYRQEARREVALKEQHFPQFVALRGQRDAEQSILWHRAMIAVLDSGDFRPASFMALKA